MKARHQNAVNSLPLHFAFGNEQLDNLIKELGFENLEELKANTFTIGLGSIVLNKDKELIQNTFKRNNEEMKEALKNDEFLQSAFEYELANHEYIITYDITDALCALGIKLKEYQESERMQKIMSSAIDNYKKDMERFGR